MTVKDIFPTTIQLSSKNLLVNIKNGPFVPQNGLFVPHHKTYILRLCSRVEIKNITRNDITQTGINFERNTQYCTATWETNRPSRGTKGSSGDKRAKTLITPAHYIIQLNDKTFK